jgi:uncharacterized protein (TIGR02246 family)
MHQERLTIDSFVNVVSRKGALRVKFQLGTGFVCMIAFVMAYGCQPNDANAREATPSPQNPMAIEETRTKSEAAIRELINGFVKAIRAKDIDGVMSTFAPEVISFDLGPPLQHGGGETFKKRWQELFESFQGPIGYEVRDLSITAGDDVAFSHSLNRISGTMKNGRKTDRWLRWTACYRKTNSKWLIIHEQVSVPVDVRNGKAILDLKP